MIYSDLKLSQKLERTEATANVDFVETRARLFPDSGAAWIEVGGTYAMFDGVDSPLTQTFGLGMFESATAEHLAEIETFYKQREAPVFHEVSPMADISLLALLNERGYQPVELTSVMCQTLDGATLRPSTKESGIIPRLISDDESELWTRVSAAGWRSEGELFAEFMTNFGHINTECSGSHPFIAEANGGPVATGMLFIYDDVAILGGASTIPEARNQGAQNALLHARLRFAYESGCTFAMMCALPGGQSQKNAQKNAFQIAYTRTKWQLAR